jgi:plastocyanin
MDDRAAGLFVRLFEGARPMRKTLWLAVAFLAALPLGAGDLHGKVVCKGAKDCADAVVYVASIAGKTFPPPKEHARMDQKNLVFVPHILPVLAGSTVDFLNSDAVLHNVYTPDACADKFNLGTWPQGESKSYTFKKECGSMLLCRVHPEMEAFVVAVPTPYFGLAQADGSYRIADVPDGSYTVKVWHPKLKAAGKPVTVAGATEANLEIAK